MKLLVLLTALVALANCEDYYTIKDSLKVREVCLQLPLLDFKYNYERFGGESAGVHLQKYFANDFRPADRWSTWECDDDSGSCGDTLFTAALPHYTVPCVSWL